MSVQTFEVKSWLIGVTTTEPTDGLIFSLYYKAALIGISMIMDEII